MANFEAPASTPNIDRIVTMDPSLEIAAAAVMLYGLPRQAAASRADSVAAMPGLGETWRVSDAARAWESSTTARGFFVAGINPNDEHYTPLTVEAMQSPPINLTRTKGVAAQVDARNTPGQTEWLLDQAKEERVGSMALFVSPFHLLRASLTLIKGIMNRGDNLALVPAPAAVAPSATVPEVGATGWNMLAGEFARIQAYQAKGHVATLGELQEYMRWLTQQPVYEGIVN